jgi:hypothetical protein
MFLLYNKTEKGSEGMNLKDNAKLTDSIIAKINKYYTNSLRKLNTFY